MSLVFLQLQSSDQDGLDIDVGCNNAIQILDTEFNVDKSINLQHWQLEHMSERVTFFIMLVRRAAVVALAADYYSLRYFKVT